MPVASCHHSSAVGPRGVSPEKTCAVKADRRVYLTPLPLLLLQTLKIGADGYNLKVGFLQNSDQRGISLSDNDIRLLSYRVRHWTMMTFVYAFRRVRHTFMIMGRGENAIKADPKPIKQANLQKRSIPNPICNNHKKHKCIMWT